MPFTRTYRGVVGMLEVWAVWWERPVCLRWERRWRVSWFQTSFLLGDIRPLWWTKQPRRVQLPKGLKRKSTISYTLCNCWHDFIMCPKERHRKSNFTSIRREVLCSDLVNLYKKYIQSKEWVFPSLLLVIKQANRPLGGHGQNLWSRGQQTTGGSVLVPASTTGLRGIK